MATEQSFVEHLQSQSGLGHHLDFKKMFGEYALYLHGKVVAFACDNQLYLKPTDAGRALLGKVSEHPPYPGAKLYFRLDEQLDDRELLREAFEATARALPLPKPKSKPAAGAKRASARDKPRLLAGGNPQVAKGDGDEPVQAYLEAIPGWKQPLARRLDVLITRTLPGVAKAIRWNSPFYGFEGQGWFLSFHCYTRYVKVAFFRGTALRPLPPGESKQKDVRYLDIHEGEALDEGRLRDWLRQASKLPGRGEV